jgi:hypothetical protein
MQSKVWVVMRFHVLFAIINREPSLCSGNCLEHDPRGESERQRGREREREVKQREGNTSSVIPAEDLVHGDIDFPEVQNSSDRPIPTPSRQRKSIWVDGGRTGLGGVSSDDRLLIDCQELLSGAFKVSRLLIELIR